MKRTALLPLLFASALAVRGLALDIGDPAPTLSGVSGWMNGDAVDPAEPDGKTVYVVEFWATWCPPCRQTIPHLDGLQATYKDRGVVVVGVTSETEAVVKPFMEQVPMRYRVALDEKGSTDDTYMKGIEGIPHAFLVGRDGKIAWQGHPLDGLDEALGAVVAGTFDAAAARALQEKREGLMTALQRGDFDRAGALIDELIAASPRDLEAYQMKAGILLQQADAEALSAHYRNMVEIFAKDAEALNQVAWMIVAPSPVPLSFRDLEAAWSAADAAVALTGGRDPDVLDTMARVYFHAGMLAEAIDLQARAAGLAEDDDERADITATLRFFRGALALQERLRKQRILAPSPAGLPVPPEAP